MNDDPPAFANASVVDQAIRSIVLARQSIASTQALEAILMSTLMSVALSEVDASRGDGDMAIRQIAAETGAAIRVSDRSVQRQLVQAHDLATRFPHTLGALTGGRISKAHVSVIMDAGSRIDDDDLRARYERAVVAVAERESAPRLRPIAKLLAEKLMPTTLEERHAIAREERGVWVTDLDDGMAEVLAIVPAAAAHALFDRLTQMGHTLRHLDRADAVATDAGDGEGAMGTGATGNEGASGDDSDREDDGVVPRPHPRRSDVHRNASRRRFAR